MSETFSIDSLAFYEAIIAPAFADLAPGAVGYTGTLNEFTLMDNVVSSRPIVDIRRAQNIMQRRDASCDIIYKKVFGANTRKVTTEEIYGATSFCRNEFYQGCLKDWRAKDPLFGTKILPYFQGAINIDLTTNSYFGDVDRVVPVNAQFSTNIYDGVFKWLKRYTTAGVIPSSQTIAIANGTDYRANPAAAYNLLKALRDKQGVMMASFSKKPNMALNQPGKAYYVTSDVYAGYKDYLTATSTLGGNIEKLENGIDILYFDGIMVLEQPIWDPVIAEIKGAAGSAAILTLRGNFVFATDKTYGEGEDGQTALEVWYEKKDSKWYYRMFLKAGTQIALPEFITYAISSWS